MCFLCVQINCAATSLSYLNDRGAGPGDEGFSDALARVPRDNKNAWAREFSLPRERPPMPKRPIIARTVVRAARPRNTYYHVAHDPRRSEKPGPHGEEQVGGARDPAPAKGFGS